MNYDIRLLKSQLLPEFPSGSSINYRNEMLYLVGDDANSILILNKDYTEIGSVLLFNHPGKRIPKPVKSDLEAGVFITLADLEYLLVVGSASREQREIVILIPFVRFTLDEGHTNTISTRAFFSRVRSLGISEVNIEGATAIEKNLLLSNRGNIKNRSNHILVTTPDFWERQNDAAIKVIRVNINFTTDDLPGISEMCYEKETDTLLITFSSEHTDNAYDDGTIGNSYLGWIGNITKKITADTLTVDHIINLADVHSNFAGEKIEGLCVESATAEELIIHLISDNDMGQSRLFKVRLKLPE